MKKKRGLGKWFPVMLLVLMTAAAVATGIHAAGVAKGRKPSPVPRPGTSTGTGQTEDIKGNGSGASVEGDPVLGVLRKVDGEAKRVTVYQIGKMEEVELSYNGATEVLTRYGNRATMLQLTPGMIVQTICKEGSDRLAYIKEDDESWVYKGIINLEIDKVNYAMSVGDQNYQYDDQLTIVNQGELVDLLDLSEKDVLTARGTEGKIYSLEVTVGHGMLEFAHYEDFIGGSIEVGYEVFDQIKENMEYVLREGSYKLLLKNGKLEVNKYITITRGETVVVDLNEYRNEVGKSGQVTFVLNPKNAELYLDNELVETKEPVELSYGDYILEVRCEGYASCSRLLSVSMPTQTIRIDLADNSANTSDGALSDLDPDGTGSGSSDNSDGSGGTGGSTGPDDSSDDWENNSGGEDDWENDDDIIEIDDDEDTSGEVDDPDSSGSGGGDSGNGSSGNGNSGGNGSGSGSSGANKGEVMPGLYIMVQKPEGASVYFDDTYVGVAPVQIEKVTGEHKITLRRDGYISKTYTIEVEKDSDNAIYSFPNLTKE